VRHLSEDEIDAVSLGRFADVEVVYHLWDCDDCFESYELTLLLIEALNTIASYDRYVT
jgi:hypothetical protein